MRIGDAESGVAPRPWTESVLVQDSTLTKGGVVVEAGCGILLQSATNSTITHNLIHQFKYTGISTGWTWVTYSRIFNIGLGIVRVWSFCPFCRLTTLGR